MEGLDKAFDNATILVYIAYVQRRIRLEKNAKEVYGYSYVTVVSCEGVWIM